MPSLLDFLAKSDSSIPPEAVRAACRRGLELASEYGGPGLTDGAKSRARSMASGNSVSQETISRMVNFFSRHQKNRADPSSKEPTPGAVAWLLWGGDAGKQWAEKQLAQDNDVEKGGLVGGIGAWQYAHKQAKKRGKPKAYSAAIYARITGKK